MAHGSQVSGLGESLSARINSLNNGPSLYVYRSVICSLGNKETEGQCYTTSEEVLDLKASVS